MNIVQVKNPRSGRYMRINQTTGKLIYPTKKTPYANILILTPNKLNKDK